MGIPIGIVNLGFIVQRTARGSWAFAPSAPARTAALVTVSIMARLYVKIVDESTVTRMPTCPPSHRDVARSPIAAAIPSRPSLTRSSSSTWRATLRSQGETTRTVSACRPMWSVSSGATSSAASSPTALREPGIRTAARCVFTPFVAQALFSVTETARRAELRRSATNLATGTSAQVEVTV